MSMFPIRLETYLPVYTEHIKRQRNPPLEFLWQCKVTSVSPSALLNKVYPQESSAPFTNLSPCYFSGSSNQLGFFILTSQKISVQWFTSFIDLPDDRFSNPINFLLCKNIFLFIFYFRIFKGAPTRYHIDTKWALCGKTKVSLLNTLLKVYTFKCTLRDLNPRHHD